MSQVHVLAWDLGTSGAKVGIVAATGAVLAHEFEPTALRLLPGGGAEQDPFEWWEALLRATDRLLARELVARSSIVALGVTAQWSGTVAVDCRGEPLRNALIWMDSRGASAAKRLVGGPLCIQGYAPLKLFEWVHKTGGAPGRSGKDSIAHILWLREAEPEIYERAHKLLEPKDYLVSRLTGALRSSFDTSALLWLTDNRDARRVCYDASLVRRSGIALEKLPELGSATELMPLRREIAERLGLPGSVQVALGSPDVHSAAIGSGATRDRQPHLYVGTSSWLSFHLAHKKTDIAHNLAALPAPIPGRYLLLNEQETAGACLSHLRDKLFFANDALASAAAPADVFSRFDAAAATSPPGSRRLVFLPWLYGERTPVEDSALRGALFNYSLFHERADVIRAVLEGIALNTRWLFGHVERFAGTRLDEVRFIGGGAKSAFWSQIFADVLNRSILRIEQPLLANLRGAALIALVGLGELAFEDVPARVAVEARHDPRSEHRAVYDELFGAFSALHRANASIFARLNRNTS